jgi:hypothetical protein
MRSRKLRRVALLGDRSRSAKSARENAANGRDNDALNEYTETDSGSPGSAVRWKACSLADIKWKSNEARDQTHDTLLVLSCLLCAVIESADESVRDPLELVVKRAFVAA